MNRHNRISLRFTLPRSGKYWIFEKLIFTFRKQSSQIFIYISNIISCELYARIVIFLPRSQFHDIVFTVKWRITWHQADVKMRSCMCVFIGVHCSPSWAMIPRMISREPQMESKFLYRFQAIFITCSKKFNNTK